MKAKVLEDKESEGQGVWTLSLSIILLQSAASANKLFLPTMSVYSV